MEIIPEQDCQAQGDFFTRSETVDTTDFLAQGPPGEEEASIIAVCQIICEG